MSHFVDFFYPLPAHRRTAGAVIKWWEQRRPAYNLIVGGVGCGTIALSALITAVPGSGGPPPPALLLGGIAAYGVLANLCYCLGPATELLMYRIWGDDAPRAGPALFRQGLIFSVGLTLFPVVLVTIGTGLRLFAGLFR